ncbi:glycosyl transferase [Streptomyces agglomeratus]|uniref:Glycosyl transferase n=1 Tax=Streptomyces agglomeratus TaxID=285458 RepID=A0A1E5PJU4_9ACTN|nr:glycosyl transferase [Streptomyces agglomeratus]OEJ42161.1 glycosyl transferase [Streptomyces agglomeratus]OEJ49328.1 glycosyl transferase [Streptomyces agglomeratus]OEJ55470.1 glycosyl transferase [Streptomyces agglomeratus]OEJ62847.1 glycosyl transferase [Streptomyces agglomeratus]
MGDGCAKNASALSIALVSEHASPLAALGGVDAGGQNVHVARLAGALADRGHRVTVYTRRDARDLPDRVPLRAGVEVHHVPAGPPEQIPKDELLPHMLAFGRYLAREWQIRPPDVVHSHFWMSGLAALHATHELRLPLLHTFHALGTVKRRHQRRADTSPPARIACEREVGMGCDRIVATCRDEVAELGRMGIPADKVRVVPCGVDTAEFTPDGPVAHRDGAYPHRLIQLGRLVPRKGAAVSIGALSRLPGAELLIVGGPSADRLDDDPEVRRLRDIAREAGVADRVRFLGGVSTAEVAPLLRSADVVLCPGDYEPFGIVPLEAMACGRPVVASGVGGQLDTVADPATGRLVPPGDPEALARAAGELLDDRALREACGEAGRRRVLSRYGWPRVAASTESVYCEVLAPQPVVTGAV